MNDTELKGTVKVWFDLKGYGWVARDDGAPDVFLHVSDVDFEPPQRGDRVAFFIGTDRQGRPIAVKATIILEDIADDKPTTAATTTNEQIMEEKT